MASERSAADGVPAITDNPRNLGLRAPAAPILDLDGPPIGAVSVVASVIRMSAEEFVTRTVQPVLEAARLVAKSIQAGGAIAAPAAA